MTAIHLEDSTVGRESGHRIIGCVCGWRYEFSDSIYNSVGANSAAIVIMRSHIERPDVDIDESLAHMPYVGMTPVVVTCKECDWVFSTDKVSEVSHAVSSHRRLHEIAYSAAEDRKRAGMVKALEIEERIKNVQSSIDFLSNADKTLENLREEMLRLSAELESLRT